MSDHAPDLRVTICHECGVEVSQAGGVWWHVSGGRRWVKRPVCGECKGRGVWGGDPDDPKWEKFPEMTNVCPSCGGTGFGGLDPLAAARTLREIAVLASRGLPIADMLTVLADRLDGGQDV